MMKVLKGIGAVLAWPFKKVGQMFAIGERFDKLEQKIDFTREILEGKINGLRTELGLKLDHLASKFEVMDDLAELRLRLDRLERKP